METSAGQPEFSDPVLMAGKSRQRSQLYGFLASVYQKEPTTDFLREIKCSPVAEALGDAGVELEPEFFNKPESELTLELAIEFTRLFVGPGKHIAPCESLHIAGGDQLWGAPAVAVKQAISETGFEFRPEYKDLPDHISVELEFMQRLSAAESEAWGTADCNEARKYRSIEANFLNNHLSIWVGRFCDRIIADTQTGYFREMAKLTRDFIAADVAECQKDGDKGERK